MSAAYQAQSCRCPASTGPSRHRCVHIPAGRPHSQCAVVCHAQQPGDTPADSGDRRLQEELIDMLQLEVAKAKVKEDIREDIEKRKESMRQIGRELVEEFEKKLELDKMRMELACSSSLADTLTQFKELEDEVQGIQDQLRADKEDLLEFEARSASQQNQGLFFKQLYQPPPAPAGSDGEAGGGTKGSVGGAWRGSQSKQAAETLEPEVVQKLASDIKSPAVREIHSPLRLYVFTFMSLLLTGLAAIDASSSQPSPGQDLLYVLISAGLGWQAWNERQALLGEAQEQQ